MLTRRLLTVLALGAALALVAGCGNRVETRTVGETEGLYIEDRHYLAGLPSGTLEPTGKEAWFGVWLRVQNTGSGKALDTATDFKIVDTQENTFEPIELEDNVFAYAPERLVPEAILPNTESPPGQGPIQGSLLLFKLTTDALQNRPLEFKITSPTNPEDVGIVDLDV